jgi:hypothetical protein
VDLNLGVIEVSRSVVVVPGGVDEKTTKTDTSRRVALDPVGIALLEEYKDEVKSWAEAVEVTLLNDVFIFSPSVDCTTPFRPDNVTCTTCVTSRPPSSSGQGWTCVLLPVVSDTLIPRSRCGFIVT